jgi:predicted membrane protein
LYLTGPVLALLTTLVVGWLTVEMSNVNRFGQSPKKTVKDDPEQEKKQRRFIVSGLGVLVGGSFALFVWATSYEVIDRSLVPMADVAAALFTTLVWIALLRLLKRRPGFQKILGYYTLWALTAGVALGLAFDMRYTQLMLVFSVGLGLGWLGGISWRQRAWLLLVAGTGALIAALPDIIYRWQVFGSPLANPQARELTHFSLANVFPTLSRMLQQLFMGPEFGLLAPFLIAGLTWQWQRDRRGFVTLAGGALAVLALQLPYESLRLRDLLPLFPLFVAWTGLGLVWMWRILVNLPVQAVAMPPRLVNALFVCIIFLSLLLPTVRVAPLVTRTWQPHRASFGYVTARERAALNQLATLTPNPAAIGAHLNGGAIALHSQRWPFYPGGWTEEESDIFLARMAADDIPVFLLDDGPLVRPTIERLAAAGRLRRITRLDVPLADDRSSGQLYEILPGMN